MMTKSDTIEAIQKLNPTASPDFLAGFSNDELAKYLDRLSDMSPAWPVDAWDETRSDQPLVRNAATPCGP